MITLLSTGSNAHGQLGNSTLTDSHTFQPCSFTNNPPNSLPPGTLSILNVVTGANHTLVLLELLDDDRLVGLKRKKKELWGCGDGRAGQLGKRYKGDDDICEFRKIELSLEEHGLDDGYSYRLISASWETSYAVLSCSGKGDVVISFGSDEFGDLGVGSSGKRSEKDFEVVRFDHLSTPSGIRINPSTLRVESITSGQRHTIVHIQLSEPADTPTLVVGWGSSRHGQLGPHLSNGKPPPFTSVPRIIEIDGVISTALGIHHSLFLHSSGQISVLGSNRKGQLQLSLPSQDIRKIGCTWNGSYAVIKTNEEEWLIHSSGSNSHGQMGWKTDKPPDNGSGIVHFPQDTCTMIKTIACGSEHVLVLARHNTPEEEGSVLRQVLWGWGWNEHGNLGIGNTDDACLPLKIWSNEPGFGSYFQGAQELIGIWAGAGTSWICCSDGR